MKETLNYKMSRTWTNYLVDCLRDIYRYHGMKRVMYVMKGTIDDENIMNEVIQGRWIMMFNDNGTGKVVHRNNVPKEYIESIGGLPELMTLAEIKEPDCKTVDITAHEWDAGWISPQGKVWAKCGQTYGFLHCYLAEMVFKYQGWDIVKNCDYELEKIGYMKFGHDTISFAGYYNTQKKVSVTERQLDRIYEFMERFAYPCIWNYWRTKSVGIEHLYDMDDEQWEDFFER